MLGLARVKEVVQEAPEYIAELAPEPLPPILKDTWLGTVKAVSACKMVPKLVPSVLLIAMTSPVLPSTTGASSMEPPGPPMCRLGVPRHGRVQPGPSRMRPPL